MTEAAWKMALPEPDHRSALTNVLKRFGIEPNVLQRRFNDSKRDVPQKTTIRAATKSLQHARQRRLTPDSLSAIYRSMDLVHSPLQHRPIEHDDDAAYATAPAQDSSAPAQDTSATSSAHRRPNDAGRLPTPATTPSNLKIEHSSFAFSPYREKAFLSPQRKSAVEGSSSLSLRDVSPVVDQEGDSVVDHVDEPVLVRGHLVPAYAARLLKAVEVDPVAAKHAAAVRISEYDANRRHRLTQMLAAGDEILSRSLAAEGDCNRISVTERIAPTNAVFIVSPVRRQRVPFVQPHSESSASLPAAPAQRLQDNHSEVIRRKTKSSPAKSALLDGSVSYSVCTTFTVAPQSWQ